MNNNKNIQPVVYSSFNAMNVSKKVGVSKSFANNNDINCNVDKTNLEKDNNTPIKLEEKQEIKHAPVMTYNAAYINHHRANIYYRNPYFNVYPKPYTEKRPNTILDEQNESKYNNKKTAPFIQNITNNHQINKKISSERYKTEICESFRLTGYCKYHDYCLFAHGMSDLRPENLVNDIKQLIVLTIRKVNVNLVQDVHIYMMNIELKYKLMNFGYIDPLNKIVRIEIVNDDDILRKQQLMKLIEKQNKQVMNN